MNTVECRFRIHIHRVRFRWFWQLTLDDGQDVRDICRGVTTSRRRALKQARFWIRISVRKYAIADHAWVIVTPHRR